uniref:Uncharacterized protein n=1 Tax=Macaca fascicularis TaxID=9541 RepID=Q9GMM2_MACFA|nr:hypothetical protein [Macaca fascicularis]
MEALKVRLPSPWDQLSFCILISGGLASSSLISGIPDSFSYALELSSPSVGIFLFL